MGGGVELGVGESTLAALTTRNLHFFELGVGFPSKFLQFVKGYPLSFEFQKRSKCFFVFKETVNLVENFFSFIIG